MLLTNRDLEIIKALSSYGMLSTSQIESKFFRGIALTTVLRRLRMLEKEKYFLRAASLPTHEVLWSITEKGARACEVEVPKRHWSKNLLEHDYKLLSLRLHLEGNGIAQSWTPEHQIRSMIFRKYGFRGMRDRVIPDGLMSCSIEGKMQSIAVELELTLKNETKLKRVLRHYQETSDLYGVWYVVKSKSMIAPIRKLWNDTRLLNRGIQLFISVYDDEVKKPAQMDAHHLSTQKEIITSEMPPPPPLTSHPQRC